MDLADRIGRGAVAALDLAPLDRRFADLSRQVLEGGASRFATVVSPNDPVTHVVPVGVPEGRVDFGALVLQPSRAALVWRDGGGLERTSVIELDATTRVTHTPLMLGGEEWTRFDLADGRTRAAFLLPPTSSTRLRSAVVTLLGATPAGGPAGVATPPPAAPDATIVRPQTPVTPSAPPAPRPPAVDYPTQPLPGSPAAWTPHDTPLYRDAPRDLAAPAWPPSAAMPGYGVPTPVPNPGPAPASAQSLSLTVVGFLAGLAGTLLVGLAAMAMLLR